MGNTFSELNRVRSRSLAGDELTMRFVEADTADTPRPYEEAPADDVEPEQTKG